MTVLAVFSKKPKDKDIAEAIGEGKEGSIYFLNTIDREDLVERKEDYDPEEDDYKYDVLLEDLDEDEIILKAVEKSRAGTFYILFSALESDSIDPERKVREEAEERERQEKEAIRRASLYHPQWAIKDKVRHTSSLHIGSPNYLDPDDLDIYEITVYNTSQLREVVEQCSWKDILTLCSASDVEEIRKMGFAFTMPSTVDIDYLVFAKSVDSSSLEDEEEN